MEQTEKAGTLTLQLQTKQLKNKVICSATIYYIFNGRGTLRKAHQSERANKGLIYDL